MLVRVLNLDSAQDRMELVKAEMDKMGFEFERFAALDPYPNSGPWIGSSYSHTEMLRGVDGLLLACEDDVIFEEGALEIFNKAFAQLPEDWDMFYLGGNVKLPATRYSENLFSITGGVHCTHAILYSENARNYVLDNFNALAKGDIAITYYDHWLFCHGQAALKCFMCYPVIAYQRPNYSGPRGGFMDYRSEMEENEKKHLI